MRERHGRGNQGVPKVSYATFIWSLVVHAFSAKGSMGHHLRTMSGVDISDAAAHERRQGLSWAWFETLFASVLQPLAKLKEHPESFYKGLRLLGIDGTYWSLRNTQANEVLPRVEHGKGAIGKKAAFFKWGCAVLLELGTHQPLAATCDCMQDGREEGEQTFARRLLCRIPKRENTLLLADRGYGYPKFLDEVREQAGERSQVLVRIPKAYTPKVLQVLEDGTALIEVRVTHRGGKGLKRLLRLREVRGQVWRQEGNSSQEDQGQRSVCGELRLWTTLLDERQYPGQELLALYAQRWEQELFFRELKRHTAREQLLRAGSPQGAQAEFGVMIIAASLLAEQRLKAAQQVSLQPLRLSLTKVSYALETLLPVLQIAGDLISQRQREGIITKYLAHAAREARIPPRRSRSCQRGLRKPGCTWPCIRARENLTGSWSYTLSPISFP